VPARLRVGLRRGSDGTDLGLHVVSPDAQPVFDGARVAGNGGALDVDVTTTAQIAVVQDEGSVREKQQVFRVPLRKPGELTLVRSFHAP
jgi:uncharacterized protein YfaP (DUF2135 family)